MYDRLLVAVDHSETSPRVLAAAKELALLSKGKVWVLHLLEKESDQEAAQPVRDGVDALKQAGVDAEGEIRPTTFGHAAREILADAKEHDADVIIMGSRGRSDFAGAILGSTAHKVIHLADRPVLVIR
jgi:nucleotide-binding universal stress UspA family protein